KLVNYLQENDEKFLKLMVGLPSAPTDLACFVASTIGMRYVTYIRSVLIGSVPIVILYTTLGEYLLTHPVITLLCTVLFFVSLFFIFSKSQLLKNVRDVIRNK
ncbi:MAG: hypothetical protein ACRC5C_06850, partial [Bacilli bacterium]